MLRKEKMKNQNNQRRQFILLTTITTLFLLGAFSSTFAQSGIGAKYGARDPKTCADKTLPKTGAPSAAQAGQYVICGHEHVVDVLYLDEDVTVQVGKGRSYNMKEDYNVPNIDVKVPVYPIRGSLKQYSCDPIRTDRSNLNRNCRIYTAPNATGLCYKDTFGDWNCGMNDGKTGDFTARDVAPPSGGATTDKNKPNNDAPQTENKKEVTTNKDENGFPKVDFSAMEKWFEVIRYEYVPEEQKLYLYIKPKVDERQTQFLIEFRDKDGILLQSREQGEFVGIPSKYNVQTGDTVKVYTTTPREELLKQAVSAKIVRRL
jgi:hypothetical protein